MCVYMYKFIHECMHMSVYLYACMEVDSRRSGSKQETENPDESFNSFMRHYGMKTLYFKTDTVQLESRIFSPVTAISSWSLNLLHCSCAENLKP